MLGLSLIQDNLTIQKEVLPYVTMAYQSNVRLSTGSPPYTVLGWEIFLSVDVVSGINASEGFNNLFEHVIKVAGYIQLS